MDLWWFAAACCVMVGGIIGTLDLLFTTFAPIDLLDEMYLVIFGAVMFVLDAPLNFKLLISFKQDIHKYCRFLTRLTGRGVWYIFMGTTTFASLWENSISKFLAVVLGLFVFGVGVASTTIGVVKSRKLEKVRLSVYQQKQSGGLGKLFQDHARNSPTMGLTQQEFNEMCSVLKGVGFSPDELAAIFNALTSGRVEYLSQQDLSDWTVGSITWL
jgi:hypothetical protein